MCGDTEEQKKWEIKIVLQGEKDKDTNFFLMAGETEGEAFGFDPNKVVSAHVKAGTTKTAKYKLSSKKEVFVQRGCDQETQTLLGLPLMYGRLGVPSLPNPSFIVFMLPLKDTQRYKAARVSQLEPIFKEESNKQDTDAIARFPESTFYVALNDPE